MAGSVNKYGGFYVGRYEMSLDASGKAQSVKGAPSATADSSDTYTWYGLYATAKTYTSPNNTLVSSMIWGSQYDAMMIWMGAAANTTIDGYNTDRTTGTKETDKINNVYDLYGNSCEWTLEATTIDSRTECGGSWSVDRSPSFSRQEKTSVSGDYISSRLALYIK